MHDLRAGAKKISPPPVAVRSTPHCLFSSALQFRTLRIAVQLDPPIGETLLRGTGPGEEGYIFDAWWPRKTPRQPHTPQFPYHSRNIKILQWPYQTRSKGLTVPYLILLITPSRWRIFHGPSFQPLAIQVADVQSALQTTSSTWCSFQMLLMLSRTGPSAPKKPRDSSHSRHSTHTWRSRNKFILRSDSSYSSS